MRTPHRFWPYANPAPVVNAALPPRAAGALGLSRSTFWALATTALLGPAAAQTPTSTPAPTSVATSAAPIPAPQTSANPAPLMPIAVDLPRYLGTWYQVALYPNKFQAQCARDTTASYRAMPDGSLEVTNACRMANGELTQAVGQARFAEPAAQPVPTGGASSAATEALRAAKLEVRFAPKWLAWLPWVWGDYWVIDVASDYRFAVVSEPKRQFLWVLSRSSALNEADEAHVRRFLQTQGFDLTRLQMHAHSAAAK